MKPMVAGVLGVAVGVGLTLGALHLRPFRYLDYSKTITRGGGDFTIKIVVEYRRDILTGKTWWRYQDAHPRAAWALLEPEGDIFDRVYEDGWELLDERPKFSDLPPGAVVVDEPARIP